MIEFAKQNGAKGLAWMKVEGGKLESNIAKYFSDKVQMEIIKKTSAKEGNILLFAADTLEKTNAFLSALRKHIAEKKNLILQKAC